MTENEIKDIFNKSYQMYRQYGESELFKILMSLFRENQEKDIGTMYPLLSEALGFYRRNKEARTEGDWDEARKDGIQLCRRFPGLMYGTLVAELLCMIERDNKA